MFNLYSLFFSQVPAQSGDAGKMSPARYKDDDYKRKEVDKRSHEKVTEFLNLRVIYLY